MATNERDVIRAVSELRGRYPQLAVDGLQCAPKETCIASLEYIIEDALKHLDQVDECRRWLRSCPIRKTYNTLSDTYTYKHEVEAMTRRWVSHSSMLIAIQLEGLEMKQNPSRMWAGLLKLGARRP